MTRRDGVRTSMAVIGLLALAGCSPAPDSPRVPIAIACGPATEGGEVFVGERVRVARGADGPCDGLAVGGTQMFSFRSSQPDSIVGVSALADIADDGSLSFELEIPADMRLGDAVLEAVPRVNPCDDDTMLDCPPPKANVTVRHRPSALRLVDLRSAGLAAPELPAPRGESSFVLRGPARDQLTVVLIGHRCETVPIAFVATAPRHSLELVSGRRTAGACYDGDTPWTSVIEVPARYAAFRSVKVDNVPAEFLPAGG